MSEERWRLTPNRVGEGKRCLPGGSSTALGSGSPRIRAGDGRSDVMARDVPGRTTVPTRPRAGHGKQVGTRPRCQRG